MSARRGVVGQGAAMLGTKRPIKTPSMWHRNCISVTLRQKRLDMIGPRDSCRLAETRVSRLANNERTSPRRDLLWAGVYCTVRYSYDRRSPLRDHSVPRPLHQRRCGHITAKGKNFALLCCGGGTKVQLVIRLRSGSHHRETRLAGPIGTTATRCAWE